MDTEFWARRQLRSHWTCVKNLISFVRREKEKRERRKEKPKEKHLPGGGWLTFRMKRTGWKSGWKTGVGKGSVNKRTMRTGNRKGRIENGKKGGTGRNERGNTDRQGSYRSDARTGVKDGVSIIERWTGSIKPSPPPPSRGWTLIIEGVVDSYLSHVRSENAIFATEFQDFPPPSRGSRRPSSSLFPLLQLPFSPSITIGSVCLVLFYLTLIPEPNWWAEMADMCVHWLAKVLEKYFCVYVCVCMCMVYSTWNILKF